MMNKSYTMKLAVYVFYKIVREETDIESSSGIKITGNSSADYKVNVRYLDSASFSIKIRTQTHEFLTIVEIERSESLVPAGREPLMN